MKIYSMYRNYYYYRKEEGRIEDSKWEYIYYIEAHGI